MAISIRQFSTLRVICANKKYTKEVENEQAFVAISSEQFSTLYKSVTVKLQQMLTQNMKI